MRRRPQAIVDLFDFDVRAGISPRSTTRGIAVSEDKAEDRGWRIGDTVPVLFAETGFVPLTLQAIYERRRRSSATR